MNRGLFHQHVYTRTDPQSVKRQSGHQSLFALLGSSRVKAARKMLVKLTIDTFTFIFCKLFYPLGGNSQNFLRKFVRFFLTLRCFKE